MGVVTDYILGDVLMHDHSEEELGAILDSRYVNVTGDTMTGGLTVQPAIDTLTALIVNDKDANRIFTIDSINNRAGVGTSTPAYTLDVSGTAVAKAFFLVDGRPVNNWLNPQKTWNYSVNSLKGSLGLDTAINSWSEKKVPTVFETGETTLISSGSTTNGNVLIAYKDVGNSNYITYAVYDSTGTVVKAAATIANVVGNDISVVGLANNRFMVIYSDANNSNYGTYAVYNQKGVAIVSPTAFNAVGSSGLSATKLSTGNVAIAYPDAANSSYGTYTILDPNGNVILSSTVFRYIAINKTFITAGLDGKVVLGYRKTAGGLNFTIWDSLGNIKVSETSITSGDGTVSAATANNGNVFFAFPLSLAMGLAIVYVYNSDGVAVSNNSSFESGSSGNFSTTPLPNGNMLVAYSDSSNSNYGTYTIFDPNAVVVTGPSLFNSTSTSYIDATTMPNGQVFFAYEDLGNSNQGTYSIRSSGGAYFSDNVGIGVTDPDTKLEVFNAGTQLKLSFDATDFATFAVDTNHDLTIKPSSTGQVILQPTTDSTDFFQILDADSGTPVLNVDATNERVGIGTVSPLSALNVAGTTGISWGANTASYGLVTIGTGSSGTSGSLWVNTGSFTSSPYNSGLGVSGTWNAGLISTIDVGAYGVKSANYSSVLAFGTTKGTTYTERMRINGDGQVGIGTTNPTATLEVGGANAIIRVYNDGTTDRGFELKADNDVAILNTVTGGTVSPFAIKINNTEALRITTTGNVGIGTTAPLVKLDVRGALYSAAVPFNQLIYDTAAMAQGIGSGIGFGGYVDGSNVGTFGGVRGQKENSTSGENGGYLSLLTRANGGSVTEKVRIDSSGNVGIGTTLPQALLGLKKTAPTTFTAADMYIKVGIDEYGTGTHRLIGFGYTSGATVKVPAYIGYIETDTSAGTKGDLIFGLRANTTEATVPTEIMRITSGGSVGIGTTGPGRKLEINVGAATGGARLTYNDADGSAAVYADLLIDSGGDLHIGNVVGKTLVLDTPVYKDINLGAAAVWKPTAGYPDIDELKDEAGADTGVETYAFALNESISGAFEMQHDYLEGGDLTFHIHWQGITAPAGGTDNVQWRLKYTITRDGQTINAATTVDCPDAAITAQYQCIRSDFAIIEGTTGGYDGGNIKIGDQFCFVLTRVDVTADEYGGDALLLTCGVHYPIDTVGSRAIGTK